MSFLACLTLSTNCRCRRWRWALVSPDGVAPIRMVGVSASVYLPLHHKVQKFSSGTGSPSLFPDKKGRKQLCAANSLSFTWCCTTCRLLAISSSLSTSTATLPSCSYIHSHRGRQTSKLLMKKLEGSVGYIPLPCHIEFGSVSLMYRKTVIYLQLENGDIIGIL